jgi:D-beta-D-heptose 7-phosphate kinase/D-beta-D-heptose 1-phosphate adenosyltransferase
VKIEKVYPSDELIGVIDAFSRATVLVVGDVMIDEFIWGKVDRISPEAPVPVVEVNRITHRLGGAANVVHNIRALGGNVLVAGMVGADDKGGQLIDMLKAVDVDDDGIQTDTERPTIIKTRIIAHHQQVVRIDRESKDPIPKRVTDGICEYAESVIDDIDAIVLSDYGKGLISEKLVGRLVELALDRNIVVSVDPKVVNFPLYQRISVVTPNHHEAGEAVGMRIVDDQTLLAAGGKLLEMLSCRYVLITHGEHGMTLFGDDGSVVQIPTVAREVFDVTGAGDTVISALTLAAAADATMKDAAIISNYAAGEVVGEVGTAVVTADRLKDSIRFAIKGKESLLTRQRKGNEV